MQRQGLFGFIRTCCPVRFFCRYFLTCRPPRLGRAGVSRLGLLTELNDGASISGAILSPSPGSRLRGEHRAARDPMYATPLARRGPRPRCQVGHCWLAGAGHFW